MMLQLSPPIPVETPNGMGMAYALIDYGPDFDLLWVCFIDITRECWTFSNRNIKARQNITMGRV